MARMAREKWYDIARDLDWELSYVDYEAVFPEWMSGQGKVPREAWAKWDEPYKVTYPEYVATQREKDLLGVRAAVLRPDRPGHGLLHAAADAQAVLRRVHAGMGRRAVRRPARRLRT